MCHYVGTDWENGARSFLGVVALVQSRDTFKRKITDIMLCIVCIIPKLETHRPLGSSQKHVNDFCPSCGSQS